MSTILQDKVKPENDSIAVLGTDVYIMHTIYNVLIPGLVLSVAGLQLNDLMIIIT